MQRETAVNRSRELMRRTLGAVLLVVLLCGCDSGSFGSHSDRGAVKLAFTAQPTAAVADEAIGPVAVTVQDAYGNTVPGARASITVAIGTNPADATLSGTTTIVASGGVAVFSDLFIDKGGSGYTLTARSSGLVSATSAPVDVTGPVKLAFIAQPTATLAGAVMRPVVVAVQDKDGNDMPKAHATVTVAIGTNPGGGVLSGTTTLPAVGGVAIFSDLVIENRGLGYTLSAEASGLTTATSGPIDVTVTPPAAKVAFLVQPGSRGWELIKTTLNPAVQVSILDEQGNVVTNSTMDVTVAIAGGASDGAILSGTSTVAAVNGIATFPDLSIDTAGWYTLTASACTLPVATSTPFQLLSSENVAPGCLKLDPLVSFGFQTIGTSSAPRAITMTNTCAVEQGLTGGAVIDGFNWQDWSFGSDCPQQLGAGASCTFDVTFSPTGPGDRLGYLIVNMDFPNEISETVDGTAIGALSMSVAPDPSGASGGFAYVASANTGGISMYRIDRDTGILAPLVPAAISAGTNPASVAVDPSGTFAYVANAGSNDVSMYKVGADGVLASIGPRVSAGTFPVSMAVVPDAAGGPGRFAYVGNARSNDLSMYSIDSNTGALTSLGTTVVGTAPWFVTVHPSGQFLYVGSDSGTDGVNGYLNSTVYAYTINNDTGILMPNGLRTTGADVPSSLAVDPSGKFVALTNQGSVDMWLWTVDPTTGALSQPAVNRAYLADQTATSIAIFARPPGKPLAYVTYGSGFYASRSGNSDNSILTYGIDPSTWETTVAGTAAAGVSPTSIAIDPSGRFAYAANSGSGSISMYRINDDGTLTPLVPGTIGL
jgi:6-phosphogluconolactonase (cycloisomerase 2 family)